MSEQKHTREEKILKFWQDGKFFNKSVDEKQHTKKDYIFYDGPPFANGLPHYGHLLTGFVKDVFARYHTSLGSKVERKFGWDCHGLPAEMESEKELKVSGRLAIKEFNGKFGDKEIVDENGKKLDGIAAFNEHCRSSVMKYTNEWEHYVTRQGRWVDFKDSYKTMNLPYMESVIAAFGKLFDKGLIYESTRVMPYSWKCETPLSNFETKMDNSYREKESKTATVKFKITENGKEKLKISQKDAYFLAWTTTPWTLPSNLALAVGREIEYGIFAKEDEVFIIAESLTKKYEKELQGFEKIKTVLGKELENIEYTPLFPYFKDTKNAFCVLIGDFVSTEDGTGIVHMAPGFGEDDFKLCRANNIETICPIDDGGKFFNMAPYLKPLLYYLAKDKEVTIEKFLDIKEIEAKNTINESNLTIYNYDYKSSQYAFRITLGVNRFPLIYIIDEKLQEEDIANIVYYFFCTYKKQVANPIIFIGGNGKNVDDFLIDISRNDQGLKSFTEDVFCKNYPKYPRLDIRGRRVLEESTNEKGKKNYDGVNEDVIKYLKSQNLWLKTEQYLHNYPHCWRTDTPLIYKSVSSWYVNVAGDGQGEVKIETGSGKKTIKERMIELNKDINWIPDHIRDGQFGKWLEGSRDWSISRNRFFGCPIPVWKGKNGYFIKKVPIKHYQEINIDKLKVLWQRAFDDNRNVLIDTMPELLVVMHLKSGHKVRIKGQIIDSIEDLLNCQWDTYPGGMMELLHVTFLWVFDTIEKMESFFRDDYISDFKNRKNSGKYIQKDGSFKITDLHRPYVDELVKHEKNGDIERIEDVFDCWFESGSMPFASVGFNFDEPKPHNFPADFIVEYVAQTRGWFYTLMILGTALFDAAPFKNCICHGVILDANGEKLSKRLRNYPDPMLMFDKYGSDAMRWFLLSSPVMRGGELYMDQTGEQIRDASRMVVVPFLNALNFFTTYSKIDNIACKDILQSSDIKSEMNQYAIALTIDAIEKIKVAMDEYNTPLACSAFEKFLDGLNNWYIRRSKDVFWESGITDAKQEAFDTLYSVLLNISRAVAPLLPFTAEIAFGDLKKS